MNQTCPGEKTPLQVLFEKHYEDLVPYLFVMLGSLAEAREVAQDAFESMQRRYQAEPVFFPRALLFRVATNFALMALRRRRLHMRHFGAQADLSESLFVPDHGRLPEDEVAANELSEHIAAVVKQLIPSQRKVFVMAHIQGKPRKEIAAALGISEKRVDKRMTRALKHCREELAKRGIDLGCIVLAVSAFLVEYSDLLH